MILYVTTSDIVLTDIGGREGVTVQKGTVQTAKVIVGDMIYLDFGPFRFTERYVLDHPHLFDIFDTSSDGASMQSVKLAAAKEGE